MAPSPKKERVTITLSPSVLQKVDQTIDRKTIRNRSHAIEFMLSQHILSKVTKVVILAGGKGAKMRPLTYEYPKAMLPINDKPLVAYTISSLVSAGLRDITIVLGHLGSKIEQYFGDGSRFGARISYVTDLEENGTAQAIKIAQKEIGNDPFLLVYGDVLAQIDWLGLVDFHDQSGSPITMATTTVTDTQPWGNVGVEGNHVVRFNEESEHKNANAHIINSGVYVVNPEVVNAITDSTKSFEDEVIKPLAPQQQVSAYHFSGKWFDVGSAEEYTRALKEWK